jgi:hypothetical protein
MDDFGTETESDYTSYWRDWVGDIYLLLLPTFPTFLSNILQEQPFLCRLILLEISYRPEPVYCIKPVGIIKSAPQPFGLSTPFGIVIFHSSSTCACRPLPKPLHHVIPNCYQTDEPDSHQHGASK